MSALPFKEDINVLVADDHQIIRDGIKALLNNIPGIHITCEASNGLEAIEILRNNSIDLVLMDITMPKLNGVEATKVIAEKFPAVKVLTLTMHDEESHIVKMLKVGAKGYILKTTGKRELAEAIKTVASGESYFSKEASSKIMEHFMKDKGGQKEGTVGRDLTKREIEVLRLIAEENTNSEIAEKLFLSPRTVDTHRRNLLQKLHVKNTAGLVKYAVEHHLVD